MTVPVLSPAELARGGALDPALDADGVPRRPVVIVVAGNGPAAPIEASALGDELRPIVVLVDERGSDVGPGWRELADVVLVADDAAGAGDDADADTVTVADPHVAAQALVERVQTNPLASLSLATLLRSRAYERVVVGLAAESATYGVLQAGSEHARWREARAARADRGDRASGETELTGAGRQSVESESESDPTSAIAARVGVRRDGDVLRITLTRAGRGNALDARMRDELRQALEIARWDPAVRVVLDAEGASFCTGGDLDEFGAAPEPPAAHLVRQRASLGATLHALADRMTVEVHGRCIGAGVELPAFAGRFTATTDASFALPEVAMGLIPGTGGTVSVPGRIGPARTLYLALSGEPIDATTARAWGLVDELR